MSKTIASLSFAFSAALFVAWYAETAVGLRTLGLALCCFGAGLAALAALLKEQKTE